MIIVERIKIKSGNEMYSAEVPIVEGYTGSVSLLFHWKEGRIVKAEVSKRAEMVYPQLSALPANNDSGMMEASE